MQGLYTELSGDAPRCLCGQHAVVTGEPAAAAAAALKLSACGCAVTLVTRQGARTALPLAVRRTLRERGNIRLRPGTEVSVAAGIRHLEAVVLRHVATGRIEACNAAALFVLSAEER